MVTIPKALDRKVKRALLRARYGWITEENREILWMPIIMFGLYFAAFIYGMIYGFTRGFWFDSGFWFRYLLIACVCCIVTLLITYLREFIEGWPRYNDVLASFLPKCADESLLHELALHYPDGKVQLRAIEILSVRDNKLLVDIVQKSNSEWIRCVAFERITNETLRKNISTPELEEHMRLKKENMRLKEEERKRDAQELEWRHAGKCPKCGGEFDLPDPPYGGYFGGGVQCRSCGYKE